MMYVVERKMSHQRKPISKTNSEIERVSQSTAAEDTPLRVYPAGESFVPEARSSDFQFPPSNHTLVTMINSRFRFVDRKHDIYSAT